MRKPVIFIPGFPASELRDASNATVFPPSPGTLLSSKRKKAFFDTMLNIPGKLVAGPPIRTVLGIAKQAQSLYDILARMGYTIPNEGASVDFAPIGWDWRLGVDDKSTLDAIAHAVSEFTSGKVVAIIHSTGALVFRAFIEAHPELVSRFDQVLAFGGAWCGTLEALFAVHVGHSESILGIHLITAAEGANLIGHAQAAYDLFPPDPRRTPMNDVYLVHDVKGKQIGANVHCGWIEDGRETYARPLAKAADTRLGKRTPDFGPLALTNVVGWGGSTWPTAVLETNDVSFFPPDKDAGDGTVPCVSAAWIRGENVRTIELPIGAFVANPIPDLHAHMWDSLAVSRIFKEVLLDAPRTEVIAAVADADEALDYHSPVTIRMAAQAANGTALPNCMATAKINGAKIRVPFKGQTRANLRLKREGIKHNVGSDVYRFTIDFTWDGGTRKNIAVSIRSP